MKTSTMKNYDLAEWNPVLNAFGVFQRGTLGNKTHSSEEQLKRLICEEWHLSTNLCKSVVVHAQEDQICPQK